MARNTPQAIQQFRGTATKLDTYTGPVGELTVDTTNKTVRIQDNATAGGHPLVNTTTAQTVAGVKTFVDAPLAPTPATKDKSGKLATTKYVDDALANIDPTDFPKGSKTQAGVIQVGDGLTVSLGVVSVGMVVRPTLVAPFNDKINLTAGTTVTTSLFVSNPSDTHVKTDYKICADEFGQNVVASFSSQTELNSHLFPASALTSLVSGETYYVFARHVGLTYGNSMWSLPKACVAETA